MPKLSVVIVGRNEGERLTRCIQSVYAAHHLPPDTEIIYVDSNSQDQSPEHARQLGAKVLVVHPPRPAAAIGRNAGWKVATGEYILFLDGDTLLNPDFIQAALTALENDPQLAIVWGHRREIYPQKSVYQRVLDLDWLYRPGYVEFCGGDALMRRQVLEAVDGYDPQLIAGEEPEMCQRIRDKDYKILHIDHPMTLHDLAITHWSQYWQRAVRTGHAYAEVSQRLQHTPNPLWQKEAVKNIIHANLLFDFLLFGSLFSLLLMSWWPLGIASLLFLALSLRSAWKARWKANNPWTLFLYGLHSQFQQIPIAIGQLSYYWYKWRGKRRQLIEYK